MHRNPENCIAMCTSILWRCREIRCIDDELKLIHHIKRKHFGIDFSTGKAKRNERDIWGIGWAHPKYVDIYFECLWWCCQRNQIHTLSLESGENWFLDTSHNVNTKPKYLQYWPVRSVYYTRSTEPKQEAVVVRLVYWSNNKPVSHILHAYLEYRLGWLIRFVWIDFGLSILIGNFGNFQFVYDVGFPWSKKEIFFPFTQDTASFSSMLPYDSMA